MIKPQPAPTSSQKSVDVLTLVIDDLMNRSELGRQKYGTKLMTHNGRDALIDAYEEALDLVMYLKQALRERDDNKKAGL